MLYYSLKAYCEYAILKLFMMFENPEGACLTGTATSGSRLSAGTNQMILGGPFFLSCCCSCCCCVLLGRSIANVLYDMS